MKFISKNTIHFFLFLFVCILWVGVFFILPDFIDNPSKGFLGVIIVFLHWSLICFVSFFLLYLLAVNRYIFAILFPLFSLLGSILGFYRYFYKATLTPMLLDAALHNDLRTSLDVISIELVLFIFFNLIISLFFVWFRLKKIIVRNQFYHFAFSVLFLILLLNLNTRMHASIMQRFPFSVYHNFQEYLKLAQLETAIRINPDTSVSIEKPDSLIVVLVIGESLRADHLSLNGYYRPTNPNLIKRKNVISFNRIHSEYTNTNRSIPHILTRADSTHTNLAFTETSFISLFKKCGFSTAWISNQDPADTYVSFMRECDTIMYCHPEKSVYNYNEWLDEDLLPITSKFLIKNSANNLIILHTIGSHWYYNNHYSSSFKKFKPITTSRIITQCSPQEIVNSYDNTVLYTDYFLDRLIKSVENKNAIVLYLSDHGEVLGEDGTWLHAGDNAASQNPAFLIWYSDKYKQKNSSKIISALENKNRYFRTDILFHSILNAGNIRTKLIQNKLNIFYDSK